MDVITHIPELRHRLEPEREVAFVPTMGNLHEGHLALMRQAREHGRCVVASIFVNRLQFGPNEDFDRYPRTFEADCDKLRSSGVDVLFAPDEKELYPQLQTFTVEPSSLGTILEGEFRPGFFRGVGTVVLKLFNIVQPRAAVFGKKDYQQLMVVRHMVKQFALPIDIVAGETARAEDGLALSSRNAYLSTSERSEAPRLFHTLKQVAEQLRLGGVNYLQMEMAANRILVENQWKTDYIAVRKQADLQLPAPTESRLVVLAAAWLGKTRLIDNLEVAR